MGFSVSGDSVVSGDCTDIRSVVATALILEMTRYLLVVVDAHITFNLPPTIAVIHRPL